MTKRGKRGRGLAPVVLAALAVLLAAAFTACGGSDGGGAATAASSNKCEVGAPPILRSLRVPTWVKKRHEGTPPIVVGCFKEPPGGTVEIVGFGNFANSVCVSIENIRLEEAHGEVCTPDGMEPEARCERLLGCVTGYVFVEGMTEFSGPLDPKVKNIRILVNGKKADGTFGVAHINMGLGKQIQAAAPFGFYGAFLRGCIPPKKVDVILLNAAGKKIGTAGHWDAPAGECGRKSRAAGTSS
jgi:hypothetical protein